MRSRAFLRFTRGTVAVEFATGLHHSCDRSTQDVPMVLTATRTTWTTSTTSTSTHTYDVTYANLARVVTHNPATTFAHPGLVFPRTRARVCVRGSCSWVEHILPALAPAPMECAGETTQNTAETPTVHERSTSQEILAVRVAQRIQKQSVETITASPQERISERFEVDTPGDVPLPSVLNTPPKLWT